MNARRLTLTLEVETDAPLSQLRKASTYDVLVAMRDDRVVSHDVVVIQAQANVIKPEGKR